MNGCRYFGRIFIARRLSTNSAIFSKQKVVTDGQVPYNSDPVNDFLSSHPQFTDVSKLSSLFETLKAGGIEPDKASNIISQCPELLNLSTTRLQDSIYGWLRCNLGSEHLSELFSNFPYLLFISKLQIEERYPKISREFTHRSIFKVLLNSPHIMNDDWDVVMKKIEYLEKDLGYKRHEIASSGALAHSYDRLKERFEFLLRTGQFKVPKAKSNKNDLLLNPSISVILLTTDIIFATKVANLSLEEFEVFKELLREDMDEDEVYNE